MGKKEKPGVFASKGKMKFVSVKSIRSESDGEVAVADASDFSQDPEAGYRLKEVRGLFLRGMAAVYFVAFLSIYLQCEGLYGNNGVTPVKAELKLASRTSYQCLKEKFTILCTLPGFLKIDSYHALEVVTILGTLVSTVATLCTHMCIAPVFFALWSLYFSIYQVGSTFLWFQWDILLLEAGILAIVASPWISTKSSVENNKPRDLITMWMVKWLLFRLMFASGVVKLQSGCPTWWGLTALNYHFESQCLPTPLSYFAHHFPSWLLHLMVVGTYYIEIVVPFAFFAPFKTLKRFAFWAQVLFQISIILTGNYNFFNFLTMVLCVSLLDSEWFGVTPPESSMFKKFFGKAFSYSLILCSFYYTVKFFGLSLARPFKMGKPLIDSEITFSRVQFDWFISVAVPYACVIGLLTLGSTVAQTMLISLFDVKGKLNKLMSFLSTVFYATLCFGIFSLTLVPFTTLHKETNRGLWPSVQTLYRDMQRYHIANSYGLFRRMTGVTNGRPEVVLEYSNDMNGPWKEYHFLYKPGNTSAMPSFLVPHQPRLDWQMWFAALGTYHDNPWLVSLAYRLLKGEKSVVSLLDSSKLPSSTPKYVRASLYHYTFTKPNGPEALKGQWWQRTKDKEYMPVFSKDHAPLVDFMKNLGYLEEDFKISEPNKVLTTSLDKVRELIQVYRPEYVIWASILTLLAIIVPSKLLN